MREIKFRAWDKKTRKLRQVVNIVFNAGFMQEPNDNSVKLVWLKGYDIIEQKDIMFDRENNFELMQYTGLKDKNGKEIYEGDIVGDKEIKWVVKWNIHRMGFSLYPTTEQLYDEMPINVDNKLGFEIIGNIYENPELIN